MSEPITIAITGAAGFIGAATVTAARAAGHEVRAIVRSDASARAAPWAKDTGIPVTALDLAAEGAEERLVEALRGADAVIHAAGSMTGNDKAQERGTVGPTRALLAALARLAGEGAAPRLVLVSSMTVYDYAALPEGATLDETAALEADPASRDAYCRSRLEQERITLEAADAHGLEIRIVRPGSVVGPGRLWNGHLGHPVGPVLISTGSTGALPIVFVAHCAEGLVRAATTPLAAEDRTPPARGRVEIVNLLEPDPPDRAAYLDALKAGGWPKAVLPVGLAGPTIAAGLLARLGLGTRVPGLLRPRVLAARMKPLRFSSARARERLGWKPAASFADAMADALAATPGASR